MVSLLPLLRGKMDGPQDPSQKIRQRIRTPRAYVPFFRAHLLSYLLIASPRSQTTLTAAMEDIILQYTYPRLDAEVSKRRNHLLKAPFCVHPKTGRVCVPVDPERIEEFEPETVPTVGQLMRELDASGSVDTPSGEHHSGACACVSILIAVADGGENVDWEKTSLKPYVDMLDKCGMALMEQVRREKRSAGSFDSILVL